VGPDIMFVGRRSEEGTVSPKIYGMLPVRWSIVAKYVVCDVRAIMFGLVGGDGGSRVG